RSAALAYYSALAMAPLTLLMISSLNFINLNMQGELLMEVQSLMGFEAAQVLETVIKGAKERPDLASITGWLGLFLLILSASIIFVELQSTLNTIFGVPNKKKNQNNFFSTLKD